MFQVEFAVHVRYRSGWATFRREESIPFAPNVGLDVLDDVLGQFTLTSVAWYGPGNMFLCQSQREFRDKTVRQVASMLKSAGWTEDKEARMAADPDEL